MTLQFESIVVHPRTMLQTATYPTNAEVERADTIKQMVEDWFTMAQGDWMEIGRWPVSNIATVAKTEYEFEWVNGRENHCRLFRVCDPHSFQYMIFVLVNVNKAVAKKRGMTRIRRVVRLY